MRNFRIVLTPDELNAVIRGLEGLSYREAFGPLQQIHAQIQAQAVAAQAKVAQRGGSTRTPEALADKL